METWHYISITDKTGKEYFKTTASPLSTMSEIKALQTHLKQALKYPKMYTFIDIDTAHIVLDGKPYVDKLSGDDFALLDELFK